MEESLLIVGLGNPGEQYSKNRHNFGFMVLDELKEQIRAPSWKKKFHGLFCRGRLDNQRLDLLKPMTFMNNSGRSVAETARFYQTGPDNIIVVHDELDFPFGTVRLKKGGGAGGHKGIVSVKKELGDAGFIRVRMGIGRPDNDDSEEIVDAADYVLTDFSFEEKKRLINVIDRGVDAVERVVRNGVIAAMNEFNKSGGERDEH